MALKARTRRWLAAASEEALRSLAREVERISAELAESRAATSQMESDLAALRGAIEEAQAAAAREGESIRGQLEALRAEIAAEARDLAADGARLDGHDHALEALRLRIAAHVEQSRWDGDELRKTLAALAERVEQKCHPG